MDGKKTKKTLLAEIDKLRDPRGFIKAGSPRFERLFGRDSLIVAWQLLEIDPSVCWTTIKVLSELQGKKFDPFHEEEPGKIIHETDDKPHPEHPDEIPFPYYGSVDSTPLFVIVAGMYFRAAARKEGAERRHIDKTNDRAFLEKHWPNIKAALNWILEYGDADGDTFLEYRRKGRGLFHQGWKDSSEDHLGIKPPVAIVEAQGYAYYAFKQGASLAKLLGENDEAQKYDQQADQLKKNFNRRFWMEKEKFFALAFDGDKKQKRAITSNPGHLLFTGIVKENYLKSLIQRLFKPDLWTPYGIRTHSTEEPDFDPLSYHLGSIWPHDNWIIAQGLKRIGAEKEYRQVRDAVLKAYHELGFAPELYGVVEGKLTQIPLACHPQGWATGAILNFLSKD